MYGPCTYDRSRGHMALKQTCSAAVHELSTPYHSQRLDDHRALLIELSLRDEAAVEQLLELTDALLSKVEAGPGEAK